MSLSTDKDAAYDAAEEARRQVYDMAEAMDAEGARLVDTFKLSPGMPGPGFHLYRPPGHSDLPVRAWLAHDLFYWRMTGVWLGAGANPCNPQQFNAPAY